jgi:hypothetical protein
VTGINTSFNLAAYAPDQLRKAKDSGELVLSRNERATLSSESQREVNERLRAAESLLATFKARENALQTKEVHTLSNQEEITQTNNSVSLPDVDQLSKSDASHVLGALQKMIDSGQMEGKVFNARNGEASTDDYDVYKGWLQMKIGVDLYA